MSKREMAPTYVLRGDFGEAIAVASWLTEDSEPAVLVGRLGFPENRLTSISSLVGGTPYSALGENWTLHKTENPADVVREFISEASKLGNVATAQSSALAHLDYPIPTQAVKADSLSGLWSERLNHAGLDARVLVKESRLGGLFIRIIDPALAETILPLATTQLSEGQQSVDSFNAADVLSSATVNTQWAFSSVTESQKAFLESLGYADTKTRAPRPSVAHASVTISDEAVRVDSTSYEVAAILCTEALVGGGSISKVTDDSGVLKISIAQKELSESRKQALRNVVSELASSGVVFYPNEVPKQSQPNKPAKKSHIAYSEGKVRLSCTDFSRIPVKVARAMFSLTENVQAVGNFYIEAAASATAAKQLFRVARSCGLSCDDPSPIALREARFKAHSQHTVGYSNGKLFLVNSLGSRVLTEKSPIVDRSLEGLTASMSRGISDGLMPPEFSGATRLFGADGSHVYYVPVGAACDIAESVSKSVQRIDPPNPLHIAETVCSKRVPYRYPVESVAYDCGVPGYVVLVESGKQGTVVGAVRLLHAKPYPTERLRDMVNSVTESLFG